MRVCVVLAIAFLLPASVQAESTEATVTGGSFTPAAPAKQLDMGLKSQAAAKAAAAGAAMGKVQCMMMMNDARQESDKQTKLLMMMMANQQCQQAAELEKSAEENDKGFKAISGDDIPKQAKFEAGKLELKASETEEARLAFDDDAPPREPLELGNLELAETFLPSLNGANRGATSDQTAQDPQEGLQSAKAAPQAPGQPLSPVAPGNLNFDESQKADAPGVGMGGGMPMIAGNMGRPNSEAGLSPQAGDSDPVESDRRRLPNRGIASNAGPGAGGGGADSSGSRSGSGDEAFDALMAQLMGENPQGDEFGFEQGSQIWTGSSEDDPHSVEKANIFEYASVRYMRLSNEDKRLSKPGPQIKRGPSPTERALAAMRPEPYRAQAR